MLVSLPEHGKNRLDVDDLEDVILDILAHEFNIEMEGQGALSIAQSIYSFSRGQGNLAEIREHLGKAQPAQVQIQDESSDSESDDEADIAPNLIERNGFEVVDMPQDGEGTKMDVDEDEERRANDAEDGWVTVTSGRRRPGR